MEKLKTFLPAVYAGIAISVGGTIYLSLDNKVAGAILFTVGLYTICALGLNLFTGKVGYIVTAGNKRAYAIDLVIIWMGNFTGTFLSALALSHTRVGTKFSEAAAGICEAKLKDAPFSLLILGVFCGFLMYAAVAGYRSTRNPMILFVCVAGFILAGFEHSVADMYYFFAAGAPLSETAVPLLLITIGNSIGAMILATVELAKKD